MITHSRRMIFWCMAAIIGTCLASTSACVCVVHIPVARFPEEIIPPPRERAPEPPVPRAAPTPDCLQVLSTLTQFGPTQIRCDTPRIKEITIRHNSHEHCPQAIQITGVQIEQAQETGFRIAQTPALPFSLKAGTNLTLQVSYKAQVLLTEQAKLVISTDHPQQPQLQNLLEAQGTEEVAQVDSYQQKFTKTDILFIVDASRSMSQEQASLVKNFSSFIQWATQLQSDFQVGVIPIQVSDTSPACLVGSPKILTSETPDLQDAFAANLKQLGTHSGREMGLETAYRALSLPLREQESCNRGLMRDNAVLSLVFISDEPDQSSRTYGFYRDFLAKLKGEASADLVRVSAVVGPSPGGCVSTSGNAKAGPRYIQLAKDFQGINASICDSNWAKSLERIGLTSILSQLKFKLRAVPEIPSIQVSVDGKAIPQSDQNGWEYLEESNSVLFRGSHVPLPGTKIEIRYLIRCPTTP